MGYPSTAKGEVRGLVHRGRASVAPKKGQDLQEGLTSGLWVEQLSPVLLGMGISTALHKQADKYCVIITAMM